MSKSASSEFDPCEEPTVVDRAPELLARSTTVRNEETTLLIANTAEQMRAQTVEDCCCVFREWALERGHAWWEIEALYERVRAALRVR